eukprot:scaffold22684_cov20-Tisochrysis_lutea.AAC.1
MELDTERHHMQTRLQHALPSAAGPPVGPSKLPAPPQLNCWYSDAGNGRHPVLHLRARGSGRHAGRGPQRVFWQPLVRAGCSQWGNAVSVPRRHAGR